MANKAYLLSKLHLQMREERKCAGLSQEQMGSLLKKGRKVVSEVENGYTDPNPLLAIRWFAITESYEHIDLVHYLYDLHPLATAPINPELNKVPALAAANLEEQINQAEEALAELKNWMLAQRPGRETEMPTAAFREIGDLKDAVKTIMYACRREYQLSMKEVSHSKTMKALASKVAMPRFEEKREELSMV